MHMNFVHSSVYYRRTVPAEQPLKPTSERVRSPPSPKRRRRRPTPSPPPISSVSSRNYSSRHRNKSSSPPRSRRHYSPFIPLPPDLADYVSSKSNRTRREPSRSPVRDKRRRTRSRTLSASSSRADKTGSNNDDTNSIRTESNVQHEPTRTLFIGNLERDIRESKLREVFGRYGTIEEST
jgi:hypothetical protein